MFWHYILCHSNGFCFQPIYHVNVYRYNFKASFFNGCFRCSLLIKCFHTLTVCCKKISWLSTMKIKIFLTIRRILIVTQWVTSILQTTMKTLLEVIDFGGLSMSDFFIKFFGWCIFIFIKNASTYIEIKTYFTCIIFCRQWDFFLWFKKPDLFCLDYPFIK